MPGLLGTTGEAGLMHLRGAFHNPFMTLPVTLPPVGALLLASAAAGPPGRTLGFTRWWMRLLAVMGFAGVGFHAYGVSRNMGGWRNWSQNILTGRRFRRLRALPASRSQALPPSD